jgi:hypothetical protein
MTSIAATLIYAIEHLVRTRHLTVRSVQQMPPLRWQQVKPYPDNSLITENGYWFATSVGETTTADHRSHRDLIVTEPIIPTLALICSFIARRLRMGFFSRPFEQQFGRATSLHDGTVKIF